MLMNNEGGNHVIALNKTAVINMISTTRTIHVAVYWQYTTLIVDVYFNACHFLIYNLFNF